MTDADLVQRTLARLETYVADLQRLARLDALEEDVREERFIIHTLQQALQASLDVASHIVADDRLGEPETLRDLFTILVRAGWIDEPLAEKLKPTAGLRNLLVHEYGRVDLGIVREVVQHRLADLLLFARTIRDRLEAAHRGRDRSPADS